MVHRSGPREDGGAQQVRVRAFQRGASLTRQSPLGGQQPTSIEARGWGWRHAGRARWALHSLDLRIEPGDRVLLLGASGVGKSTLIHALAGVLGGDDEGEQRGELLVNGLPADRARGGVGLVLQDPDSQVILARVGDDVAFGCENLGVPREEIWARVREAVDAVGLDLPLDHPTSDLSGGQKQRLALAGVLAMKPGLLLLDEPTANLDPDGVIEVREAVARVLEKNHATFVVIEHRVDVWLGLVNRVVVLAPGGGVLADGRPEDVLSREGRALAADGVWVPGYPPEHPHRATSPSGDILLSTDQLVIGRVPSKVLRSGIDLQVRKGSALAITGPNGAGKSTLGLTMAGLLPPLGGRVRAEKLAGSLKPDPIGWKSRELVTRIGSVFQDPEHQFVTGTVGDELRVGPRVLKMSPTETDSRVDELVQRLRLDHLLDANPFTLSGGEKRRLSVATVLVTRPPLLVLDEPTFGQDSRTWRELVVFLAELLEGGSAVVAVTHDAEFVSALANDHIVIGGQLAALRSKELP